MYGLCIGLDGYGEGVGGFTSLFSNPSYKVSFIFVTTVVSCISWSKILLNLDLMSHELWVAIGPVLEVSASLLIGLCCHNIHETIINTTEPTISLVGQLKWWQ